MLYHPSTILLCFYSHAKSPTRLMAPPFHTRIYEYLDFVHGRRRRRRKKLRRTMKYSLAKHHLAIICTFCCTWSVGSAGLRCHIVALLEVTKTGTQISLANPLRFTHPGLCSMFYGHDRNLWMEWKTEDGLQQSEPSPPSIYWQTAAAQNGMRGGWASVKCTFWHFWNISKYFHI